MTLYYRRRRRIALLLGVLISLFIIAIFAILQLRPIFVTLSKAKVQTMALQIINKTVDEKILGLGQESLIYYQKNDSGEINAVNANVVIMNKIANEISTQIVKEFNNISNTYIYIPFGNMLGSGMLSAVGPNIPVKIIPLGDIKTEFKTEFSSTGINQTRHKIYLNIVCKMKILSTFINDSVDITTEIPIAETVIIGGVPQTYYRIEGVEGIKPGDLLNAL